MQFKINNILKWIAVGIALFSFCFGPLGVSAYAEGYGISMSPLNQKIVLNAGERYNGSFIISNPNDNESDFKYEVKVKPFFVDNDYKIVYEENDKINQIVDWINVNTKSGILPLNSTEKIDFTIDVPQNAPAGGQYAAIVVNSVVDEPNSDGLSDSVGINMSQSIGMAQIIYAEIAGTTVRQGEVQSVDVPSFLLSGNITASSTIKNTGNTHGTATYKLQVFPLFSNEEVYTNEESPDEKTILPDRSLYNGTVWDKTPDVGIFNVKYTVEFEGVTTEVSKLVIKCPIWLIFIILFAIFALIFYFVAKAKARKKAAKKQ